MMKTVVPPAFEVKDSVYSIALVFLTVTFSRYIYSLPIVDEFTTKYGPNFPYYLTMMIPFSVFWIYSSIMLYFDIYKPQWARQYKVQQDKFVTNAMIWKGIVIAMRNLLFVALPLSMVLFFVLLPWRGASPLDPLPTYLDVIRDFVVFVTMEEIMFYYSHRILHLKSLYSKYHKLHHEFTAPIGVVSIYCTILEMAISNILPVISGPFLMGSHASTILSWFLVAFINTINTHSGYEFPGMASPLQHDFHHEYFTENFGVMGILDTFHKTNTKFLAHLSKRKKKAIQTPPKF